METKLHTPSAFGLGVLAGLEDCGRYDNPFHEWYDKHDHARWINGYTLGERLIALLPSEVSET